MQSKIILSFLTILAICQQGFADPNASSKPLSHEVTPYAGPHTTSTVNLYFTADFLWWKAKQAGMVYATNGVLTQVPTAAQSFQPLNSGHNGLVNYDWDPGFKVGAGYKFWHDNWDLYAEYTWLHTDGSDSLERQNGLTPNFPLPEPVAQEEIANRATSRAHLRFNVIDLELGRNFYLSPQLTMRPHFGFKGTWQTQDWRTRYFSSFLRIQPNQGNTIPLTGPYRMHHHNRYYGVGIRAGFDTAWHFTYQWSLFGDIAWTAMWSNYRLRRHDTVDDTTTGQKRRAINIHTSFYELKYVGELQIGLRFETWFADNSYHFQIQVGWEEQIWINHMSYIGTSNPIPYFDLTLHGLTLMTRFDF